ncbi:solute carrier family 23 protein [Microbacterium sp. C7(2022)]|uniref:SulP family inorganic anion transporter n=1 Tax=Microbacterium sp. C7(2022) TaxID=2992759 RepID=UPI00237C3BA8|nr:solute carrier family 23 protein [Microbacterium sp. C7(2022)]MDE0545747.1 SulP family inorganic anion transporter [Microbacterium sp. C7(2022)]
MAEEPSQNTDPVDSTPPRVPPASRTRFGRPTGKDVVSGFVTGLFSIPEGMAYASIGGFAAPLGLWSGVIPTIFGSVFARSVLMVTTLTSAIALSSQSVLADAGLQPDDIGAVATLTVMVGVVMLIMGLLKLGSVMSYVSTAVMTGFTTGIALQIVAGVIGDVTGYDPSSHNTVGKFIDAFVHVDQWQGAPVVVALSTVAVWFIVRLVRPLRSLATLIALLVVTLACVLLRPDIELVSDIADIMRALPPLSLPDLAAVPALASGAVAIALVALAQAAGISAAVPNPDRSRPDTSKDFTAQGLANIAGGFFSALPTGGSLSRTGVATSAGASTRWSGIFAGAWLAIVVLLVGPWAGYIPMAVIGGLMLVIGGELIVGRRRDIALILQTSWMSVAAMVVTFVATTALPLQQAIFLGAGLSIVLTAAALARHGRLIQLVPQADGDWSIAEPPPVLESHRTTVLHYSGTGLFSEVNTVVEEWPDLSHATDAAIVFSLRTAATVPSATFFKAFRTQADRLREQGIALVICGVPPRYLRTLRRAGVLDDVDAANVIPASSTLMGALTTAYQRAEELRSEMRNTREQSHGNDTL